MGDDDATPLDLTKFEVGRLVGMRALQLSEGAFPNVVVPPATDPVYTAAMELHHGVLDALLVRREDRICLLGRRIRSPALASFLFAASEGTRSESACGKPRKGGEEADQ